MVLNAIYPVLAYATPYAIARVGCGTGPNAYANVCTIRATPTARNKCFAVVGSGSVNK